MSVPVTMAFMKKRLGFRVDTVHTAPAACMHYIESEAVTELRGWPDDGFIQEAKEAQSTFQAKLLERQNHPWDVVIQRAMTEGTLWYTMKPVCPPQAQETLDSCIRFSQESGLTRPNWEVKCAVITSEEADKQFLRLRKEFGQGCTWAAEKGWDRWGGQPFIICRTPGEFRAACSAVDENRIRVIAVFLIDRGAGVQHVNGHYLLADPQHQSKE
jgi:hypothetical protein